MVPNTRKTHLGPYCIPPPNNIDTLRTTPPPLFVIPKLRDLTPPQFRSSISWWEANADSKFGKRETRGGDGEMHTNANGVATATRVRSIRQLASRNFVTDGHVWIVLLYYIENSRVGSVA